MTKKKGTGPDAPKPAPAAKRPNPRELSGEDRHLWDFVTKTIKPLQDGFRQRGITPHSQNQPQAQQDQTRAQPQTQAPLEKAPPAAPRAWLPEFRLKPPAPPQDSALTGGIDRRTADRLRRGQMPIEGVLDLHGLRQAEAQQQLIRFLQSGHHAGRRCVLVITGKGGRNHDNANEHVNDHFSDMGGVLRRMLPLWLDMNPLRPIILDYAQARPKDGGGGAFYILLRRQR